MKMAMIGLAVAMAMAGPLTAQGPPPQRQERQRFHRQQPVRPRMERRGMTGQDRGRGGQWGVAGARGSKMSAYGPHVLLGAGERLGLTEEQRSRLDELATQYRSDREEAAASMREAQEALTRLWDAEDVDPAAIRTETEQLVAARSRMELAAVDAAAQAKVALTPEQRGRVAGWMDRGSMGQRAMPRGRGQVRPPSRGYRRGWRPL